TDYGKALCQVGGYGYGWVQPPEIAACRTRKAQEYWNGLTEQQKYDTWMKPAYAECVNALRTLNQLYAAQWAGCTIDELVAAAAFLGNFNEEAARWAAEHLEEHPWV
ncbi:unnamed protein product, partial [marine sediment metagenome]